MQSEMDTGTQRESAWPLVALKSVAIKIRSGATPKGGAESYLARREEYVLVRSQNVFDHRFDEGGLANISDQQAKDLAGAELQEDDVLLNITGDGVTFGRACVVPKHVLPACVNQHVMLIRTDSELCQPGYLAAWLSLPDSKAYIESFNSGGSRRAITKGHIESFEVPLPPLDVQRGIGDLADNFNNRIDLLRQSNATLESIARALFKSWFIDFTPVRAKQESREPEGMDAATAALFPAGFEASAQGVAPSGWPFVQLGAHIELVKGCSYKGEGLSDCEGAYMFNLGCFNAHRVFATEKVKRYTGEYKQRHQVASGDLLIANTDMTQVRDILGRPVFVPDGFEPAFVSHHVFKVNVKRSDRPIADALRLFLFFSLQQASFRERAIGYATGTTVLALPATAVLGCPVSLPPDTILVSFANLVGPLFARIRQNEKLAATLAAIRNTLLPRLISGKLRLPEAQQLLEDALA